MATHLAVASPRAKAADWLVQYLLPLGWIAMLTGLFWIGDRALYHKLYYAVIAVPVVMALALRPSRLALLFKQPLFIAFVVFSAYTMLTLLWSPTDNHMGSLLKRPLYIGLLFFGAGLIAEHSATRLVSATRTSALIAVLGAVMLLADFVLVGLPRGDSRLSGMGALYNPLLTSHVLGAFAAYWMATSLRASRGALLLPAICLAILLVAILATGSRTPLMALTLCFAWLAVGGNPKRGVIAMAVLAAVGVGIALLYPDALLQRGLSYRPQVWATVLGMVAEHPWFGHGYDAHMTLMIPGLSWGLADPHNIELAVLHEGGIVGLLLWAVLYAVALVFCWRYRNEPPVTIAGAWLVFGFGAGLTEGGAFLSRPKEHWLLIWLPMAFVYGLALARKVKKVEQVGAVAG